MRERDREKMIMFHPDRAAVGTDGESSDLRRASRACDEESIPMIVHVRPDLYRAFMRCVWMLIHEEGMSPLEAQNTLIEDFLRHHGC